MEFVSSNFAYLIFFLQLCSEAIVAFAWTRLLKVSKVALLWVMVVVGSVLSGLLIAQKSSLGFFMLALVPAFVFRVLAPLLLAKDNLQRRVPVVVIGNTLVVVLQLIFVLCVMKFSGVAPSDLASPSFASAMSFAYFPYMLLLCALLAWGEWWLERIDARKALEAEELSGSGLDCDLAQFERSNRGGVDWAIASLIPVVQFCLLLFLAFSLLEEQQVSDFVAIEAGIAAAACLAVEVLSLALLDHKRQYEAQKFSLDLLQGQLEAEERQYEVLAKKLSERSRLRHDFRNHVQVLEYLLESGEVEEAKSHIDKFRQMIDEHEAGELR